MTSTVGHESSTPSPFTRAGIIRMAGRAAAGRPRERKRQPAANGGIASAGSRRRGSGRRQTERLRRPPAYAAGSMSLTSRRPADAVGIVRAGDCGTHFTRRTLPSPPSRVHTRVSTAARNSRAGPAKASGCVRAKR